jgi:hypothetical protein
VDDGGRLDPVPAEPHLSAGRPHRRVSRLRQIAMIVVFDLGGPLLAYAVLRAAGASAVAALVLSGVFPALGIGIGALVDGRLDVLGVMVLAGLLVATVLGLVSHDVRLYLLEGSVPSVVFALGCLLSLRLRRPLIFRLAVALLGPGTPKGRDVAAAWRYPGFRRAFRTITLAWGIGYLAEAAIRVAVVATTSTGFALLFSKLIPYTFAVCLPVWTLFYGEHEKKKPERLAAGSWRPAAGPWRLVAESWRPAGAATGSARPYTLVRCLAR